MAARRAHPDGCPRSRSHCQVRGKRRFLRTSGAGGRSGLPAGSRKREPGAAAGPTDSAQAASSALLMGESSAKPTPGKGIKEVRSYLIFIKSGVVYRAVWGGRAASLLRLRASWGHSEVPCPPPLVGLVTWPLLGGGGQPSPDHLSLRLPPDPGRTGKGPRQRARHRPAPDPPGSRPDPGTHKPQIAGEGRLCQTHTRQRLQLSSPSQDVSAVHDCSHFGTLASKPQ